MIKTKFINKTGAERFMKQYKDFQGLSKLRMYKTVPENFINLLFLKCLIHKHYYVE